MADLREAFETWVRRVRPVVDLTPKPDGNYRSQAVRNQWEAFQAGVAAGEPDRWAKPLTVREVQTAIREAGGIVHGDGNIFFTNVEQFLAVAYRCAAGVGGIPTFTQDSYIVAQRGPQPGIGALTPEHESGVAIPEGAQHD